MKKIILSIFLMILSIGIFAQTIFMEKGKIEFERKTNVHRLYFSGETDAFAEEFKKLIPAFKTDYFDLVFSGNKTLYKPGRETPDQKTSFFESPASANTIFKDLSAGSVISQKQVYETQFLLTDSMPLLEWKMESETRTIAGYECRKAVTRICDSVVVVAFYSDEILPSSGPESMGGLPGMILGLAIPRLYTTWFATKVELITASDEQKITPPQKGKKSTQPEMIGKVRDGIRNWGEKYYHKAIWYSTL
ncbi:MAG: GLPGLI family protein [Flavisolibacter sp.]